MELFGHQCKVLAILSQPWTLKPYSTGGRLAARQLAAEVVRDRDKNKYFFKKGIQQTHQKEFGINSHGRDVNQNPK